MDELIKEIDDFENHLSKNVTNLRNIKITTIATLVIIFICNTISDWVKITQQIIISWNGNRYPDATFLEFVTAEIFVFLILVVPTASLPLFYFMNQKEILKFQWNLKTKIIFEILNQYDTDYHLSIHGEIPNHYLKEIGLENGYLSYTHGDDYFFGQINSINFKCGEVHSKFFLYRKFDGIIALLSADNAETIQKISKKNIVVSNQINIKYLNNNVFIMKKGRKSHFELKFRRNRLNREKLFEDYKSLSEIVSLLNIISLEIKKTENH